MKKLLNYLLGYKIEATYPDGGTETARAYLGADCTVRAWLLSGSRCCILQYDGVIRGLWPNNKSTWKKL